MEEVDKIYLVPHTHYDAIWVFTKEDYYYININLILRKVVDLLEKEKNFKFLIEQTFLLEVVEKRYPKLFEKLKKYIKEGRIEIGDGEYLMADTMLPQEESLIREILYGKKYIKEKFGVDVLVMWQADSFGLNAQLPQIYAKSGYKYLAFRRGCPIKKPSEFFWRGLDGTKILSHWMPLGYRAGLDLKKLNENYRKLKKLSATNHILMPSGSGVTMPQEETVAKVKEWNKTHSSKMKISTPSEFFEKVEKSAKKLPLLEGEMYSDKYSEIFRDCSSSRIWIKKALREYEIKLLNFEKFSLIHSLIDKFYPEEIENCWRKILFLAFHDVVTGTAIDEGYEYIKQDVSFLKNQINFLMPNILNSIIESDSNNEVDGEIIVFNPLSWNVSNWVEVNLNFEKGKVFNIKSLKSCDEELDVELINFSKHEDGSIKTAKIGFVPTVPALGYKIYKIKERSSEIIKKGILENDGNKIKNKFFEIAFSPESGLIDVIQNKKLISQGNELVIEEEIGDLYYHKSNFKKPLKTESGEGIKYGMFKINDIKVEKSSLRVIINIEINYYSLRWPYRLVDRLKPLLWRHNFLSCNKKIIIYRDLPRIDFIIRVRNKHPRIRLRTRFKTPIKNSKYVAETQFGAISRKVGNVYPSLRWIDFSDKKRGVTLINKGIPENEIKNGFLYLTLLRSISMLSSDGSAGPVIPVSDAKELKDLEFKYSLYPHSGDWKKAKSYQQGYEFNYSLIAFQLPEGKKYRAKRSFLKIEPQNIILTTIKKPEDNEKKEAIIRFYEAEGKKTKAWVNLFKRPQKVEIVNLMERGEKKNKKKIKIKKHQIELEVNPFEIVTLRVKF